MLTNLLYSYLDWFCSFLWCLQQDHPQTLPPIQKGCEEAYTCCVTLGGMKSWEFARYTTSTTPLIPTDPFSPACPNHPLRCKNQCPTTFIRGLYENHTCLPSLLVMTTMPLANDFQMPEVCATTARSGESARYVTSPLPQPLLIWHFSAASLRSWTWSLPFNFSLWDYLVDLALFRCNWAHQLNVPQWPMFVWNILHISSMFTCKTF